MSFDLDHSDVSGSIVADGHVARCGPVLGSGQFAANLPRDHCDGPEPTTACHRRLALLMLQDRGHEVDAPAAIGRCLFDIGTEAPPEPEQFKFQLFDASRSDGSPVSAILAVTDVDCSGTVIVTSSTTSSTVVGCSAGACRDDEACIDGECVATNRFEVEFAVTEDLRLGALQLGIRYDAEDGAFVGVGQDVACERNPTINGFVLYNHVIDHNRHVDHPILIVAITSVVGFNPPWLTRCLFEATNRAPTPETFAIDVVDASDPKTDPLQPTVIISRIQPVAPE